MPRGLRVARALLGEANKIDLSNNARSHGRERAMNIAAKASVRARAGDRRRPTLAAESTRGAREFARRGSPVRDPPQPVNFSSAPAAARV